MSRPTSYAESAQRWNRARSADVALLSIEGQDHIAGLAAECACKALLIAFGAKVDPKGGLDDKRLWVHMPWVFDELMSQLAGRNAPAVCAHLPPSNPFADWSIDDRYVQSGHLTASMLGDHLSGLDDLMRALQAAALDGDL